MFFFAIGCVAGALGPAFYGALIGDGSSRAGLFVGYLIGAGIMVTGGLVEVFLGVNAAGKSLEQVTKPLTSVAGKAAHPPRPPYPPRPPRRPQPDRRREPCPVTPTSVTMG
jgi:hypothetical protein